MCTVTYLPTGQGEFIITSNRDERKTRPTLVPAAHDVFGQTVFFPKDYEAGGSWFAVSKQFTIVVLNGADQWHRHQPPYRKSRGLVMLDFFSYNSVNEYTDYYDFEGIEPFTFIIIDNYKNTIHQLRWNETALNVEEINSAKPAIWSSATLYDEETRKQRAIWFEEWLQTGQEYTVENIMHFHYFGGTGDKENDLVMNRGGRVQTVSITSYEHREETGIMWYEDLLQNQLHKISIL